MKKEFYKTANQAINKAIELFHQNVLHSEVRTSSLNELFHQNVLHSEVRTSSLNELFPDEKIKGFVRETEEAWRVRVRPKTQFEKTSYVSKIINPFITLVFGKLLDPVSNPPASTTHPKIHLIDFKKLEKYKKSSP
jgi:hypothetical protein